MTPGWEWGKGPPAAGAPTAQVEAIGHMQSPGGWAEAGRGGQEHGPVWALVLRTEHWVEGDSHPSGRGQPGQDGVARRVQTRTPSQATVAATPWKRQLRRGGFSVSQCGRPGPLGGTPQDTEPMALQWCRPHAQLLGPQTHLLYVTPEGSKHLSGDHRAKPFSLRSNARKWYRCHLYPTLQTASNALSTSTMPGRPSLASDLTGLCGHGSRKHKQQQPDALLPRAGTEPPSPGPQPSGCSEEAGVTLEAQTALHVCEQHPPEWSPDRKRHQKVFFVRTEGKRGSERTGKNDRDKGASPRLSPLRVRGPLDRSQRAGSNGWEEFLYLQQPGPETSPTARGMFWNKAGACRSLAARRGASP